MKRRSQHRTGQFCLTPAQVKTLINAADNPRDRIIFELLYYCGLRRSEVIAIQTGDIDYEAGTLHVHGKGNKDRLVPIPPDVKSDLLFYCQGVRRPYVFQSKRVKRSPISPEMINHALRRAQKACKLKNPHPNRKHINPHILRHSAARLLKNKGVPLEVIKEFLGHESIQTTADIYGLHSVEEIHSQVRAAMG